MPLPRAVARFNRHVTNRILDKLALFAPSFFIIEHVGRKSGRTYKTPVNAFRRGNSYIIGLTYGPESDWVRNVLANGGCSLTARGRTIRLTQPRIFRDKAGQIMPPLARPIMRLAHVYDFMQLDIAAGVPQK